MQNFTAQVKFQKIMLVEKPRRCVVCSIPALFDDFELDRNIFCESALLSDFKTDSHTQNVVTKFYINRSNLVSLLSIK